MEAEENAVARGQLLERATQDGERPVGECLPLTALDDYGTALRWAAARFGRPPTGGDAACGVASIRDLEAQRMQLVNDPLHAHFTLEHTAGLVKAEAIAMDQALEAKCCLPQSPCLRRRPPLSEMPDLRVHIETVDHDGEVGLERTPALELAEDLVVVLDEPRPYAGPEVLGVGTTQATACANPRDHPIDHVQVGEE
jgi:hypothetical protein